MVLIMAQGPKTGAGEEAGTSLSKTAKRTSYSLRTKYIHTHRRPEQNDLGALLFWKIAAFVGIDQKRTAQCFQLVFCEREHLKRGHEVQ
jgi:hypothetical protein